MQRNILSRLSNIAVIISSPDSLFFNSSSDKTRWRKRIVQSFRHSCQIRFRNLWKISRVIFTAEKSKNSHCSSSCSDYWSKNTFSSQLSKNRRNPSRRSCILLCFPITEARLASVNPLLEQFSMNTTKLKEAIVHWLRPKTYKKYRNTNKKRNCLNTKGLEMQIPL